jgi:hypothetical protein
MTIRFEHLFTLAVSHGYYAHGCRDFEYSMPADSLRVLRNGRLLAKNLDGTLTVLFEADDDGTPVVPLSGSTLRIGLALRNPVFPNITELGFDTRSAAALYTNRQAAGTLDGPLPVRLVGGALEHTLARGDRPVTVTLRTTDGAAVQSSTVAAADQRPAIAFDIRGKLQGAFIVEETYDAGPAVRSDCYADPELVPQNVFGIVEIGINDAFYVAPPDFTIAFEARQEQLKYYIAFDGGTDADMKQLSVADLGFGEEKRDEITFTRVEQADFTDAELAPQLVRADGAQVVLFKSDVSLRRREAGRKGIQLARNGDLLIVNLPNPAADSPNADLIIHVSKT